MKYEFNGKYLTIPDAELENPSNAMEFQKKKQFSFGLMTMIIQLMILLKN